MDKAAWVVAAAEVVAEAEAKEEVGQAEEAMVEVEEEATVVVVEV